VTGRNGFQPFKTFKQFKPLKSRELLGFEPLQQLFTGRKYMAKIRSVVVEG